MGLFLTTIAALACPPGEARGDLFTFTRITLTGDVGGNSGAPVPSINNNGVVAFRASLVSYSQGQGIYTGSGGPLTTVAFNGNGGNVGFFGFVNHPVLDDQGRVAFWANARAGAGYRDAVFLGDGGPLTPIATNVEQGLSEPAINGAGLVALVTSPVGGGTRIVTGTGGPLSTIISSPASLRVSAPAINDSGEVLFNWSGLNGFARGIYLSDGDTIHPIFQTSDPNEFILTPADVNDAGVAAFFVRRTIGTYTLRIGDGVNNRVFLGGFFTGNLPPVALNNSGTVALMLDGAIRVGTDAADLTTVVAAGDALDGSTITGLAWGGTNGFNDRGQVAFYAQLADGRHGVYVATPRAVPEPASLALLGLGGLAAASGKLIARRGR